MHISAYVCIFRFTYSCIFLHLMCIFCAYGYLYLHINCISLHILLHIKAYCYLFKTYFCIFYACPYIYCCLYHAYSCILSMNIFAYFYIFWHFVAYLLHIHAFVCIFVHILILTMQHSMFNAFTILHPGRPGHQEFTYHHRLPYPFPGFELQDPPSKSAASSQAPLML